MKNGTVGLMENDKQAFLCYYEWEEVLRKCSPEDGMELILACFLFARTGKIEQFKNPDLEKVFPFMRNAITRDTEKYEEKRKARSENAEKGGIQKEINRIMKESDDDSIVAQQYDSIIKYFEDMGGTEWEAKKFIIFNNNRNWRFKGTPFKNWKQAAKKWHDTEREVREKPGKKKNGFTDMKLKHNYDYVAIEEAVLNQPLFECEYYDESLESNTDI